MPRKVQVATVESLRQELARFERAHGMTSDEFLRRWEAGQIEERMDYFRWVGVCHLAVKMGVLAQPQRHQHAVG